MQTQKHMGRGKLVERLIAQVGSRKRAETLLKKRGQMDGTGKLTKAGEKRDRMTAEERAKDRAARSSGKSTKDYRYDAMTNSAKLTRRK